MSIRTELVRLVAVTAITIASAAIGHAQSDRDAHHPDQGASGAARETAKPAPKAGMGSMGPGMMGGMPGQGMMEMMGGMSGQGMMGMMGGMSGQGMMAMMGNCPMTGGNAAMHTEGRIAFLRAELAITAAQQTAFDAYAAALKKSLQGMQGMQQKMSAAMQTKSPVERLDAQISLMEGRLASLKETKPALAKLYGTFSTEQKSKADQLLPVVGCMM